MLLVFKTPNFRDSCDVDTGWSSQRESFCAVGSASLSQKLAAWLCSCLEFWVKHNRKLAPQLTTLSQCPIAVSVNEAAQCTCWVFCPWRDYIPSPKCTINRGTTSSYTIQGILSLHYLFLSFHPPSPPEHHLSLPGTTLMMVQTSKSSDSVLHCL